MDDQRNAVLADDVSLGAGFAGRIEKLCALRGVRQMSAMDGAGLSDTSMYRWRRGSEPSANAVIKLADYFDVSADYLLGRDAFVESRQRRMEDAALDILPLARIQEAVRDRLPREREVSRMQRCALSLAYRVIQRVMDTSGRA